MVGGIRPWLFNFGRNAAAALASIRSSKNSQLTMRAFDRGQPGSAKAELCPDPGAPARFYSAHRYPHSYRSLAYEKGLGWGLRLLFELGDQGAQLAVAGVEAEQLAGVPEGRGNIAIAPRDRDERRQDVAVR